MSHLSYPLRASRDALARAPALAANARRYLFDRRALAPGGRSPYEIVHRRGTVSLRYYIRSGLGLDAAASVRTPLVIVPPLAVNMRIYDLMAQRSFVGYMLARGFDVYMIDWGEPAWSENRRRLVDYFAALLPEMLHRVRFHSGRKRLSLHGWSLGGVLALCHTAMTSPAAIANLVLVATPVDYHGDDALGLRYRELAERAGWLKTHLGLTAHRVPRVLLRSPGWFNSLAFKLATPAATAHGYMRVLGDLSDTSRMAEHAAMAAFLSDMTAYPGGVIADLVDYLWVGNALAKGQLPMAEPPAGLAAIRAPILNLTGTTDAIVSARCSQAMTGLVSSSDVTCLEAEGGHVGVVAGEAAPVQSWPRIADWLIERDGD